MDIVNKINIYLNYTKVGEDQYGNSYYRSAKSSFGRWIPKAFQKTNSVLSGERPERSSSYARTRDHDKTEEGFLKGEGYKRVVMYRGIDEPTKVPPSWHAWLHYLVDNIPESKNNLHRYVWQKDHIPNLTGTSLARFSNGHVVSDANKCKVSSDYKAWDPNSEEAI